MKMFSENKRREKKKYKNSKFATATFYKFIYLIVAIAPWCCRKSDKIAEGLKPVFCRIIKLPIGTVP